jgi:hypothetical protein
VRVMLHGSTSPECYVLTPCLPRRRTERLVPPAAPEALARLRHDMLVDRADLYNKYKTFMQHLKAVIDEGVKLAGCHLAMSVDPELVAAAMRSRSGERAVYQAAADIFLERLKAMLNDAAVLNHYEHYRISTEAITHFTSLLNGAAAAAASMDLKCCGNILPSADVMQGVKTKMNLGQKTLAPQHCANPGCMYKELVPVMEESLRCMKSEQDLVHVEIAVDGKSQNGVGRVFGALRCVSDNIVTDTNPTARLDQVQNPDGCLDFVCYRQDNVEKVKDLEGTKVTSRSNAPLDCANYADCPATPDHGEQSEHLQCRAGQAASWV